VMNWGRSSVVCLSHLCVQRYGREAARHTGLSAAADTCIYRTLMTAHMHLVCEWPELTLNYVLNNFFHFLLFLCYFLSLSF